MSDSFLPPLARSAMDRDYLARSNPDLFDVLWQEPGTRVLAMHQGKVLLADDSEGPRLNLLSVEKVPTAKLRVYLGRTLQQDQEPKGSAIVLAVLSENGAATLEPEESKWHSLRSTGAGLSDLEAGIFAQALALSNWHESHQHCPRCGTPTMIEQGGWVRRCLKDQLENFPRTDPAVIVAITDQQDRLLLGSQGSWGENRWSVLAGFVEPGESLEAAVIREMAEESGLVVTNPRYVFSQSWPFPYSLMLGFEAKADSSLELRPDGQEIVKLRWFTRDEILNPEQELLLPSKASISRALIERWLGQEATSAKEFGGNGEQ